MASPAAASVRPPRPKKEPQTLVIPKNAAEEQKLKLERLMKNPVSRSGLCGPARPGPVTPPDSGTLHSVPQRRPGRLLQHSCRKGALQHPHALLSLSFLFAGWWCCAFYPRSH